MTEIVDHLVLHVQFGSVKSTFVCMQPRIVRLESCTAEFATK